jgi:tetratricopeptide (TPR) repeat protein
MVDRLFDRGDIPEALTSAAELLRNCLAAGEHAHDDASYDLAMAHFLYGRVSTAAGHFDDALEHLQEAHRRFLALAALGDNQAERMAVVVIGELGDCLLELRRPDEAAQAYEQVIEFADRTSDSRQAALSRRQLGTARLMQQRFAEARDMYTAAIGFFEKLDEPGELANTWHQLGMAQKELHEFDQAEEAYKRSLAIEVRRRNRRGEAQTLFQFGNLYWEQRLGKEAADFYGQASDTFAALHDLRLEAAARTSLAQVLGEQHQYDPARVALRRAIECQDQLGHGARIWETWDSMRLLEQAAGNTQGAAEAREHAITTYLAFRRAGGESQTRRAALYARVAQATTAEEAAAAESWLAELSSSVTHPQAKAAVRQLRAVLSGERERALADDPELGYLDAAELRLLLESRTDTTSPD